MSKLLISILVTAAMCAASLAHGEDYGRVVYEVEIDSGVEAVWDAFTTDEGLMSWMAPLAEIELQVGGLMRSNYNPDGELGDSGTIENTILAFDPHRMLALKATGFPEGFSFAEVASKTWSVFYFDAVEPSRTKVTVVGLGYTDEEQSQQMRSFFAAANAASFGKLKEALKETPASE